MTVKMDKISVYLEVENLVTRSKGMGWAYDQGIDAHSKRKIELIKGTGPIIAQENYKVFTHIRMEKDGFTIYAQGFDGYFAVFERAVDIMETVLKVYNDAHGVKPPKKLRRRMEL